MSDSADLQRALEHPGAALIIPDIYFDDPDNDFNLFEYVTSKFAVILRYGRA